MDPALNVIVIEMLRFCAHDAIQIGWYIRDHIIIIVWSHLIAISFFLVFDDICRRIRKHFVFDLRFHLQQIIISRWHIPDTFIIRIFSSSKCFELIVSDFRTISRFYLARPAQPSHFHLVEICIVSLCTKAITVRRKWANLMLKCSKAASNSRKMCDRIT